MAGTVGPSLNCKTIEEFQSDPRIGCKYGNKCYQTNPVHINKYKHPPKGEAPARKGAKRTRTPHTTTSIKNESPDGNDASSESRSPKGKVPRADLSYENNSSTSAIVEQPSISRGDPVHSDDFENEPELPPSPSDVRQNIKQKFLFEMPEDFYCFWDFCQTLNGLNPAMAFRDIGFKLVGPYDVLSSHFKVDKKKRKQSLYLLHWRYYYDPPGFQTVLKGDDKNQFHVGYYRDEPKSMPAFLASNCAAKDGVFTQMAENIFGAFNVLLNDVKKTSTPFLQTKVSKVQKALHEYAKEYDFTLEQKTNAMKLRDRKSVSKTFNGLGLVVPVEKKTDIGYRELIETDANLRRILNKIVESEKQDLKDAAIDQLQQVITAANIANDECDFGTSVELGLDLLAFGSSEFGQSALQLLTTGYRLLGHPEFAKIAEVHINNRKKGANLDMFKS